MILLQCRPRLINRKVSSIRICSSFASLGISNYRFGATRTIATKNETKQQSELQTSVFTIPNMLTMSRIACVPFIGHYIFAHNLAPALTLFGYSCVTDYLDGYIARRFKMKSIAGTILDPIADKLLMIVTTVSLSFAPGPQLIPLSIALVILGRDVSLGFSALYFRYASMKERYKKISWSSYWDFFHYPSAEVKPTQISKYNTFFQMIYLGFGVVILLVKDAEDEDEMESQKAIREGLIRCFSWMGYIVTATTIISGGSYVFSKDAVKFLKK